MLIARLVALSAVVVGGSALAADKIEALGGEKCGSAASPYTVEFLAPDETQVEARAKVAAQGVADLKSDAATLSLDGAPCPAGSRCRFLARKGNTYTLVAQSSERNARELCISVARP
jgi:hypothetical protein